MIRFPTLVLVGCAVCAGLILAELGLIAGHRASPVAGLAPATSESQKSAGPPANPAQPVPETVSSAKDADSRLRSVRLTGVGSGRMCASRSSR
jgi:hypothetical protein